MEQQYINYAFISYQRKDEKWAKWLQRKLENYKLPVSTTENMTSNASKYIRPVFRDKTDLTAGPLPDALKEALNQSRYLIVICSPNAVKSPWVNEEIDTFIKRGKTRYIIPFIVSGEPYAEDNNSECFRNTLKSIPKEQEPLGVNVAEGGKDKAFVRTVAYMLGVKFDELWKRHERQKRKIRNIFIVCATILALMSIGIYDYSRTKIEYYADWVDCYGVAEGVHSLNQDEVFHRAGSYKFEYKRVPLGVHGFYSWRLFRVSLVNSKGKLEKEDLSDRYCKSEYYYTDSHLTEIINYNEFDTPVVTYRVRDDYEGNSACIYDLESTDKQLGEVYINASTTSLGGSYFSPNQNKSKIKRFHYTRDENGHIVKVTYHAFDGEDLQQSAVSDNNGIFGEKYTLDSIGRRVCYEYLGYEGQPTMNKYGVSMIIVKYNQFSDIEEYAYYGIDRNLVINETGYAIDRVEYDEYERPVSARYFDVYSKPCYNTDLVAGYNLKWNDDGFKIYQESVGIDNKRCYNKENIAYAEMSYDGKGNRIETMFYDIKGNKSQSSEWNCGYKVKYDSNNRVVSVKNFDALDNECVTKTLLVTERRFQYDSNGNIIEDAFYSDGKRAFSSSQGYSYIVNKYNKYNQLESQTLYDENNKQIYSNEIGCSVMKFKYDGRGNVILRSYYDEENKPIVTKYGYSSMIDKYDNYGNVSEEIYLGVKGERVFHTDGYSKLTIRYNNKGEAEEYRYYDTNDSLCIDNNWVSIYRYKYDNYGRMVDETFLNNDSIPCISKGFLTAGRKWEYDTRGNIIRESFIGKKGELSLCNTHQAYVICKYDNRNNRIESAYFGADNNPCVYDNKYHIIRTKYNDKGAKILEQYFDANGKPVKNEGAYQQKYDYTDTNLTYKAYNLDSNGRLMNANGWAYCLYEYDKYGRIVSLKYYDCDNKPCWRNDKSHYICKRIYSYDKYGNIEVEQYFGPNNKLSARGGWATKEATYDDHSRPTFVCYRDANGKLLGGPFNAAVETYTYNGEKSRLSLYGTDSTFIINVNIIEIRKCITEISYTDSLGKLKLFSVPKIGSWKFAIKRNEYDKRGLLTKQSYFNADEKLYSKDSIAAYTTYEYDEKGRFIKQMCYNAQEQLTEIAPSGTAILIHNYDKYGNLAEQSYYDKNSRLAKTSWGWSRMLREYNEYGVCIKDTYYYPDGKTHSYNPTESKTDETDIPEEERQIVIMSIETTGQMYDKGYRGTYIILLFNDWNATQSLDEFVDTLMNSKGKKKHLVFIAVTPNGLSEEIIDETFSEESLNARIMDSVSETTDNKQFALRKYNEWLASKKK